ncbi:UNVERIFIED_CONTAM: UPF0145 protein [Trichonephila clavipes]
MLLSSLESVPGHEILRQFDVVYGSTVRSKHVGRDLMAGLKNIVGGELTGYTELLEESRQEATQRMIDKARALGANAIVGIRFSTSNIAQGASELFVYGTAVVVQPVTPKLPDPFVGWGFGRHIEQKHLRELDEKEKQFAHIRVDTNRFVQTVAHGQMVSSNVVISHDYFKYILANIQNFFGGRLTSYESVVERARREAMLRLKQEADRIGANHIMGVRMSTTELGMQGGMVEVFAYGTAIVNHH